MPARPQLKSQIIEKVDEIYRWLDHQIAGEPTLAGSCSACGKCCDFDAYDHCLFVTTPEVLYLAAMLENQKLKPMTTERCPYNIDGRCSVHQYRFAGCRIFCCHGDIEFQGTLSESAIRKFRLICEHFQLPYTYTNLAEALNGFEQP